MEARLIAGLPAAVRAQYRAYIRHVGLELDYIS